MDGNVIKDGAPLSVDYTPTLLGGKEQLEYLDKKVRELANTAIAIKDDSLLPTRIGIWIENGITCVMQAGFNIKLIQQGYGRPTNGR